MIADAPRTRNTPKDEDEEGFDYEDTSKAKLTTKEEIKSYLKGLI